VVALATMAHRCFCTTQARLDFASQSMVLDKFAFHISFIYSSIHTSMFEQRNYYSGEILENGR
jgi:hypothetical protein